MKMRILSGSLLFLSRPKLNFVTRCAAPLVEFSITTRLCLSLAFPLLSRVYGKFDTDAHVS